jgi:hypothetical protein
VRLVVRPGAEPHRVRTTGRGVTHDQTPQAVDRQRLAVRAAQRAENLARVRVDRVDPPVTEVADQQVAGELSEGGRCDRHAPRRVEHAVADQSPHERAVVGVDVDESVRRPGHVVLRIRVL